MNAIIPVTHDPAFLVTRIIKVGPTDYNTPNRVANDVLFCHEVLRQQQAIRWQIAQIIGGSIMNLSAPDINKLEVPTSAAFGASATIDNPAAGADVEVSCILVRF